MKSNSLGNIILLQLLIAAPFVALGAASTNSLAVNLQIESAIVARAGSNVFMTITLKNIGSTPILIPYGSLPWARYAMTLALVEASPASVPLRQELVVSDRMPGDPWKIEPQKTLKGEIDLTGWFPELTKSLQRTDVIAFWSYQPEIAEGVKAERLGGWKTIPKLSGVP